MHLKLNRNYMKKYTEKYFENLIEKSGNPNFKLEPIDVSAIVIYSSRHAFEVKFKYKQEFFARLEVNFEYSKIDLTILMQDDDGSEHRISAISFRLTEENIDKVVLAIPSLTETAATSYRLYMENMTAELNINDLADEYVYIRA